MIASKEQLDKLLEVASRSAEPSAASVTVARQITVEALDDRHADVYGFASRQALLGSVVDAMIEASQSPDRRIRTDAFTIAKSALRGQTHILNQQQPRTTVEHLQAAAQIFTGWSKLRVGQATAAEARESLSIDYPASSISCGDEGAIGPRNADEARKEALEFRARESGLDGEVDAARRRAVKIVATSRDHHRGERGQMLKTLATLVRDPQMPGAVQLAANDAHFEINWPRIARLERGLRTVLRRVEPAPSADPAAPLRGQESRDRSHARKLEG